MPKITAFLAINTVIPQMEEAVVDLFPDEGNVVFDNGWRWEGPQQVTIAAVHASRFVLDRGSAVFQSATHPIVHKSAWRRVVGTIGTTGVYGPVTGAPLTVAVVCPPYETRHIQFVAQTRDGYTVPCITVTRNAPGTRLLVQPYAGQYAERSLIPFEVNGKPRVFFQPR